MSTRLCRCNENADKVNLNSNKDNIMNFQNTHQNSQPPSDMVPDMKNATVPTVNKKRGRPPKAATMFKKLNKEVNEAAECIGKRLVWTTENVQSLITIRGTTLKDMFLSAHGPDDLKRAWNKVVLLYNELNKSSLNGEQLKKKWSSLLKEFRDISANVATTGNPEEPVPYPPYWDALHGVLADRRGLNSEVLAERTFVDEPIDVEDDDMSDICRKDQVQNEIKRQRQKRRSSTSSVNEKGELIQMAEILAEGMKAGSGSGDAIIKLEQKLDKVANSLDTLVQLMLNRERNK